MRDETVKSKFLARKVELTMILEALHVSFLQNPNTRLTSGLLMADTTPARPRDTSVFNWKLLKS